jgi:asparagine N-glycosylation enzyme membrane subunit Stt3
MIKLALSLLILFGFAYSVFISFYGGFYLGFVFILITIGFASTIYCIDKRINRRIIFYVWVAIMTTIVLTLIVELTFSMISMLKA